MRKETAKERRMIEKEQEMDRRRKLVQDYIGKAKDMEEEKSARPPNFPEKKHGPGSPS